MSAIIFVVIFGVVLAACGINVIDQPIKTLILIAFVAAGALYLRGHP